MLREEKREELQERIQEKRATRQAQLTQRKQQRVSTQFNKMSVRIDATIQRLEILITRIESRLVQIEAQDEDINTESIQNELDTAKDLLEEIRIDLISTNDALADVLASEDPKASFEILKNSVRSIKENLQDVHQILVKTIGDIKGLRVGQNK